MTTAIWARVLGVIRPIGILVLATAAAGTISSLAGPNGLTASVFVASGPRAPAVHAEFDSRPSSDSVERLAVFTASEPARITWDGFLFCEEDREYELGLATNGPARVLIDGRLALDSPAGIDLSPEKIRLTRGQHLFSLEYEQWHRRPALDLSWDVGNPYRLQTIPATAYAPRALDEWRWRLRAFAPVPVAAVASVWSVLLVWLAWLGIRRALPEVGFEYSREIKIVLAMFAGLFGLGIWWGWPGAWAPDELDPAAVLGGLGRHFSNGWFDKYPPLHYYLLTLVYAPTLVAGHLGWLDVDSPPIHALLFMQGRLLTLAMALGTLVGVAMLATRTFGRVYAWPSAVCAGAFLPFVFYAKTVNVDVPYVFWFVLSCFFLAEAHRAGSIRDVVGFGITAAAAIATKDQAYALYVLPSLHLAWRMSRLRRGVTALVAGTVAGLGALALIYNVLFNYSGFLAHVQLVTGPASADYRMFPSTLAGEWALARTTLGQLLWALGWPGSVLVLMGILPGLRRPGERVLPLWTVLAMLSYYLTFIAVIGYVYDRFLLPVTTLLALGAAIGLRWLLDDWPGRQLGRLTAGVVLIGWLVWRVVSVDVLLIRDSRYAAEAWLGDHVTRDALVVSVDEFGYVPRLARFRQREIQPTITDTLSNRPDFIVVNSEFLRRSPEESPERTWLEWLESGAGPYEEVYRYKTPLRWSALAWQPQFLDRREDDFTNLDKANPEIVIFKRKP